MKEVMLTFLDTVSRQFTLESNFTRKLAKDFDSTRVVNFQDFGNTWVFNEGKTKEKGLLLNRMKNEFSINEGEKLSIVFNSFNYVVYQMGLNYKLSEIDHKFFIIGSEVLKIKETLRDYYVLNLKEKELKKELSLYKDKNTKETDSDMKSLIKDKMDKLKIKISRNESEMLLTRLSDRFGYSYSVFFSFIGRYDIKHFSNDLIVAEKSRYHYLSNKYRYITEHSVKDTLILFCEEVLGFSENDYESSFTENAQEDFNLFEKEVTYTDIHFNIKRMKWIDTFDSVKALINEKVTLDLSESLSMTDTIPVAPVKPIIAASMVASGSVGSVSREIFVNDGEKALIKSVMIQNIEKTEIIINKERTTEKNYIWKSQLGVFNLLRKEVEIIKE